MDKLNQQRIPDQTRLYRETILRCGSASSVASPVQSSWIQRTQLMMGTAERYISMYVINTLRSHSPDMSARRAICELGWRLERPVVHSLTGHQGKILEILD